MRIVTQGGRVLHVLFLAGMLASCASRGTEKPTPLEKGSPSGSPFWYLHLDAPKTMLLGYGEGVSRDEADARAQNDLASQMEVHIRSTTTLKEREEKGESDFLYQQTMESLVDVVLHGARRLREESRGERHYSAWYYDNRRLRARVLDAAAVEKAVMKEGKLKSRLLLSRFLKDNASERDYQLVFRKGNSYVLMGGESIPVSWQEMAENCFPLLNSHALTLVPGLKNGVSVPGLRKNELYEGQLFFIRYKPRNPGAYLNLFYVDNGGFVLKLVENQRVHGREMEFPDKALYDGLIAEKNPDFKGSTDMILAVETPGPLDFTTLIPEVSPDKADSKGHESYDYGLILEQLNAGDCSTLILRIH